MFYFPMCFMLVATLCSLCLTVRAKVGLIGADGAMWGDSFQLVFAAAMVILAVILAVAGVRTIMKQGKGVKA